MSEESTNRDDVVDAVSDPIDDAATVEETPAPAPTPAPTRRAVVSGGDTDTVLLSRCVYKSKVTRKSLSVHHLQRRLAELGYRDVVGDKDGWYGDLTFFAVKAFQEANKLEGTGHVDADTLAAIFKGDTNVTIDVDN